LGGSAEPGIVLVSKDENGNGLPDDEWYELAGSEYGKDTETRNYEITYYRPQPANGDIRWTDNQGGEGFVYRNSYHQQDSYYPNWIKEDEITFRGTRLKDNAINEGGTWVGYCYPWGYADNHPNRSEFSQFKIDWAVDQNGNHVELDKIDFVKIYTAVNRKRRLDGRNFHGSNDSRGFTFRELINKTINNLNETTSFFSFSPPLLSSPPFTSSFSSLHPQKANTDTRK